ncbi:MAG: glycosyltransferase family 2 protein [Phycisphaerae bacterium]|nr:glycosyltransferase family 2 protein [Phycisphaerae bacterium]MDD5380923.1 glycosyltransferase family 2 protein [Phycisphaerae bacterium]
MKKTAEKTGKNDLSQALVVLLISVVIYLVLRTVFTAYAEYKPIEKVLAFVLLFSEMYVIIHSLAYFVGIFVISRADKSEPAKAVLTEFPLVDILIPSRHEPRDILENTVIACYNLGYPGKIIHILDDSSEQSYKDEAEEIAKKYGCKLFRRQTRHGAKAGVVNDCLKTCSGKYVAIFDVDQNPIGGFLATLISILEADDGLALVQTPQYYSNLDTNKVACGANMQQAIFYENICEAKSLNGAMMCCGTNVVIRRSAIDTVGGFDESSVTEDFATTLQLHLEGFKTLYYNHVGTFGQGPRGIGPYLAQQSRWSLGVTGVLKKVLKKLFTQPSTMRFMQWWEYVISSTYYLSSWAFLLLLFCPIVYLFFGVPSFFMNPVIYGLAFVPYLLLSTNIFYTSMRSRNYRIRDLLKGQAMFFVSLPIYLKSSALGLCGIKGSFKITSKAGSSRISYLRLWPQITLWLIALAAIVWGINLFVYTGSVAAIVNTVWIIYYFAFSMSIFYFNEE